MDAAIQTSAGIIPIDSNYKMIREGSTQSYFTRSEALEESIKLAERICLEYNFNNILTLIRF